MDQKYETKNTHEDSMPFISVCCQRANQSYELTDTLYAIISNPLSQHGTLSTYLFFEGKQVCGLMQLASHFDLNSSSLGACKSRWAMPTYSTTLIRYRLCFPTLTERVLCICLLCAASSLLYAKKTSHGSCFSGNMLRVSPSAPWLMVTYTQ